MGALRPPPGFVFTAEDMIDAEGGRIEAWEQHARKGLVDAATFIQILNRDIDEAIDRLQQKAPLFGSMNEDGHSQEIVTFLVGRRYDAGATPYMRGHVDIHVYNRLLQLRWNGEAKIHGGYGTAVEGMKQLLSRYATGTHEHGGFFLYVRRKNAGMVQRKWRKKLVTSTSPSECSTVADADEAKRFRFQTTHRLDSGVDYVVRHHVVNMYFNPIDKSGVEHDVAVDDGGDEDEDDLT